MQVLLVDQVFTSRIQRRSEFRELGNDPGTGTHHERERRQLHALFGCRLLEFLAGSFHTGNVCLVELRDVGQVHPTSMQTRSADFLNAGERHHPYRAELREVDLRQFRQRAPRCAARRGGSQSLLHPSLHVIVGNASLLPTASHLAEVNAELARKTSYRRAGVSLGESGFVDGRQSRTCRSREQARSHNRRRGCNSGGSREQARCHHRTTRNSRAGGSSRTGSWSRSIRGVGASLLATGIDTSPTTRLQRHHQSALSGLGARRDMHCHHTTSGRGRHVHGRLLAFKRYQRLLFLDGVADSDEHLDDLHTGRSTDVRYAHFHVTAHDLLLSSAPGWASRGLYRKWRWPWLPWQP